MFSQLIVDYLSPCTFMFFQMHYWMRPLQTTLLTAPRMLLANRPWVISLLLALAVIAAAQRITTPASVFELQAGESVDLPCNVEGLDENEHVVTWMKDEEPLTIDGHGWDGHKEDFRLAKNVNGTNHALTITSLKGSDSADYQCNVMNVTDVVGSVNIVHKLNVPGKLKIIALTELSYQSDGSILDKYVRFCLEPPSAKIQSANGSLVVYDRREVLLGEDVHVPCHVFGSPLPYRRWYRVGGGRLPMRHSFYEMLWISNAVLSDSGIYSCRAITDNAVGSAQVEIVVKGDAASNTTTSTDVTKRRKYPSSIESRRWKHSYFSHGLPSLHCIFDKQR